MVIENIKDIEKKHNLSHYEALQRFMFERILERISLSNYQDNFILKGGLLLSAMFGVDNRTTKDMDTSITGINLDKVKLLPILNEILSIDLNDNVSFEIIDILDIRDSDYYGGNKYQIIGKFNNLKVNLEIDISTGDSITPGKLRYNYPLLFSKKTVIIYSYNLETILAEKIETILRRSSYNSRMKDYYDVYFILANLSFEINKKVLKLAINNTLKSRSSTEYLNDYKKIIYSISISKRMEEYWNRFNNRNQYVKNISLNEILTLIEKLLDEI